VTRPAARRLLRGAVLGLWLAAVPAGAADEVTEALDASIAAQRAARESQLRIDKLDTEARALRDKRRALQWRALQQSAYAEQLEQEAAVEEKKRGDLEAELRRIAATGTDLLPLMRRMVDELETFVQNDLPFLRDKRLERVAGLRELLDDTQRGNADKFRRVMEAYRTEVDYGHSIGAEDLEVDCAGARGPATVVRVGRIGLYCLAADGERGAYWDAGKQRWEALDDDGVGELQRALPVARGEGPPELLVLPVRVPEPAK
jgi:hypothetical protein